MDRERKRDVSSSIDGGEGRRAGARLTSSQTGSGALRQDEKTRVQYSTVSGRKLDNIDTTAPFLVQKHYKSIRRKIRPWGVVMLIWGFILFSVAETIFEPSAVFLIILGLLSFYFQSPAMLVVYSAMFCWSALPNLLSGETKWIVTAVFQVGFAILTAIEFRRLQRQELDLLSLGTQMDTIMVMMMRRSATTFPWISLAAGLLSLIGLIALFCWAPISTTMANEAEYVVYIDFYVDLALFLPAIGIGTGAASLLMHYDNRDASNLGLALSSIVIVVILLIALILS